MGSSPPPSAPGAFGALATSVRVYLANANTLLFIVALFLVPATIAIVVLLHTTIPERLLTLDTSTTENPFSDLTFEEVRSFVLAAVIGGIFNLVTTMIAIGACFKAVSDALTGVKPSWRTSVRAAMHKAGSLVWIPVLMSLLFIAGTIALLLVVALLSVVVDQLASLVALAAFGVLVYFFVRWSLAVPVLMAEDRRGMGALSRSAALIRGHWWQIFGTYALAFLVMIIVSALIGAIFRNPNEVTGGGLVLPTAGTIITSVLVTPFQAALLAVGYFNLRPPSGSELTDDEVDGTG